MADGATLNPSGFFSDPVDNNGTLSLCSSWQSFGGSIFGKGKIEVGGDSTSARLLHEPCLPAGPGAQAVTVARNRSLSDLAGATGEPVGRWMGETGREYLSLFPTWTQSDRSRKTLHLQIESEDNFTKGLVIEFIQQGSDIAARAIRAYSQPGNKLGLISDGDAAPVAGSPDAEGYGVRNLELSFSCGAAVFRRRCEWQGGLALSDNGLVLTLGGEGLPGIGTLETRRGGEIRYLYRAESPPTLWIRPGGILNLKNGETFTSAESQKALFLENGTLVNAPLSDQGNGNYANRITLSDSSRITGGPILIGAPGEEARLKVTGTGVSRQEAGYRLMGRGPLTLDIDDTTGDSGADLILAAPLTARNESETIVNKRGSGTLLIQGAPFVPGIFRIDSGAVRLDLPASSEIRMGSLEIKGNARLLCGADDRIETSTLTLEQGSVLELGVGPQGGTSFTGQNINLPGVGATIIKITASTPPIRGLWFTLIAGMNLTPDQLDRFTLDLSRSPGLQGSLSIEDGDLRFTVTQSPALQNTLLWQGADGNWDSVAENRVWQRPDGTPSAFSQESDIRFALPASTHARVEIAPDIRPGILLDESAGALTLGGAKLLGDALFLKTGTGVLTLDSLGFENQPIQILEGRLKLGTAPNTQDALGASSTPIEVRGNGTLDLNAPEGDPLPYGKEVLIHGSGENGQGIIVNSGRGNGRGFSRLKALGNTILSGPAGWKIKGIQGRGELSAPKRATLTVKGPMRPDAEIEAQDTDVTLGTLELREGGRFRITGSGNLDIDTLTLKDGSTGSFGNLSAPLAFPIHLEGTSLQGLANVGGTVEFAGPISLESGSTLALSARENGGTSRYTGGIDGTGAAIRMTGGSHLFTSDLAVDRVDLASGSLKFGDPERDNTAGKRLPGQIALSENTVLTFTSRSQEALYRDLRIEGRNAILIPGFSRDNSLSRFENLTVDLADRGLMKMGQSPADSRSRVRLDSGSTVTVETLEIQDSGSAGEVDLQIGPSATLTILGESDNACRIGHWPSQKPGRVTVDGGTLHLPNARPQIGWDAWDSALHLNSGLLKAPKGINIRTHSWSDSTYKGHFAMNSGTLQIGEGIDTALDSPQLPLLYLNGGRVESLSDWSVKLWLPTLFGSPSGRDGRLEIDTREHSISLPTPLRGGSDVRIFGNGSLSAASGVLGGPTGHWTLEDRGGADLRGASAFAGGMTVGEGAEVRVDIGSMDHYATVETLSHRTRGVPSPNQADRPSPLLGYRYHTGLLLEHGLPNSVLTITGQFKTEMRDVHFFCMADEVTGILKVGEYEHCNTWTENKRRESAFLNGPHWHNFRLIVHNNGEALATSPSVWKRAGMVVGWKRGGNDAPGTDPAKYKPFDGSSLELRPRPSATLRRVANTYGNPGNWMERSDFNDFETLGSLRETLHSHSWVKGCGSVNEITGWFRVDQAADWRFKGSYDDQIALWVDGKLLFQTARWDDVRESETIPLTRGLHAFRVRFMDTSSNTGQAWGKPDDQVLWYRIGGGNYTPFNVESLVITADPYGFIGGELALASGALLTNDASSPCSVTGTLRGEGTLEGLFRLEGAVWEVRCKAGRLQPERVAFENADPDALRDVGKIKVLFDAKPRLARYPITPALGLPGDAESLSERVEASLPDGTVLDLIPGIDPDGRLVLTNPHVETGTLILIR